MYINIDIYSGEETGDTSEVYIHLNTNKTTPAKSVSAYLLLNCRLIISFVFI